MTLGYFRIMKSIFKRNEKKYIISKEQSLDFQEIISKHMEPYHYDNYVVQNIYYDTENWDLIRASTEKPLYKEKMRLRCYGIPNNESKIFLELKKKYKGIVYKYRISIPFNEFSKLPQSSAMNIAATNDSQVSRELNYFMNKYNVSKKIHIAYKRTAFTGDIPLELYEKNELRITFDSDIRFRLDKFDFLINPDIGTPLLPKDIVVMEIKTPAIIPLWMAAALSELKIFPMPFSKYGKCYTGFLIKQPEVNTKELLSA